MGYGQNTGTFMHKVRKRRRTPPKWVICKGCNSAMNKSEAKKNDYLCGSCQRLGKLEKVKE